MRRDDKGKACFVCALARAKHKKGGWIVADHDALKQRSHNGSSLVVADIPPEYQHLQG